MKEIRKCAICGREFMAKNGKSKYCGKSCRVEGNRIIAREHQRQYSKENKLPKVIEKREKSKSRMTIPEIVAAARKAGMSYGQYVEKMGL